MDPPKKEKEDTFSPAPDPNSSLFADVSIENDPFAEIISTTPAHEKVLSSSTDELSLSNLNLNYTASPGGDSSSQSQSNPTSSKATARVNATACEKDTRSARPRTSSCLEHKPIYLYELWHYEQEEGNTLRGELRWSTPFCVDLYEDEAVFVDGMLGLVRKYCPLGAVQAREELGKEEPVVNFDDFSAEGLSDIKSHIKRCNWRVVLKWTGKYLCNYNSLAADDQKLCVVEAVQIQLLRIITLLKLQLFEVAMREIEAMQDMDSPVFRFESYPEIFQDRKGCMVPFTLRLLAAEIPFYNGQVDLSFDKLYKLKYKCTDMISLLKKALSDGMGEKKEFVKGSIFISSEEDVISAIFVWEQREDRVLYSIANQLVGIKDYRAAMSLYETIESRNSQNPVILSAMGRINLLVSGCVVPEHWK